MGVFGSRVKSGKPVDAVNKARFELYCNYPLSDTLEYEVDGSATQDENDKWQACIESMLKPDVDVYNRCEELLTGSILGDIRRIIDHCNPCIYAMEQGKGYGVDISEIYQGNIVTDLAQVASNLRTLTDLIVRVEREHTAYLADAAEDYWCKRPKLHVEALYYIRDEYIRCDTIIRGWYNSHDQWRVATK